MSYMTTVYDADFAGEGEVWDVSGVDVERRFRLGSEVTSLSRADKHDVRDFNFNDKLISNVR